LDQVDADRAASVTIKKGIFNADLHRPDTHESNHAVAGNRGVSQRFRGRPTSFRPADGVPLGGTFCVSPNPTAPDQVTLETAIASWKISYGPTTIKLQQGTYRNLVGNFATGDYSGLNLLGGYYAVPGDSCGGREVNAKNTIFQGNAKDMSIDPETLIVEGVTFTGYGDIFLSSGNTTKLSQIIVTDGHSASGPALTFAAYDRGVATLQNSLIYGNHTGGGVQPTYNPGFAESGSTVYLINDTIAKNDGNGLQLGDASASIDEQIVGYNNIFYGNSGTDLVTTYADTPPLFFNTLLGTKAGNFVTGGSLLLTNTDPQFNGDYSLLGNSPGINKGIAESVVPGGYADFDLVGNTRVVGSAIDLGAYEHSGTLYVTNTRDDGSVGSLRWAINAVNANNSLYDDIRFGIDPAGACPQRINLASPLPTLTAIVTINGYTEPGAAYNVSDDGYNGNVCIVLNGGGTTDHALWAVSGRLTLKGIEFDGFKTDAVLLSGGSGHKILGNGFAAQPNSLKNFHGVRVNGSATSAQIGSNAYPFDHNVFAQNDIHIVLAPASGNPGNHIIAGNLIGYNIIGVPWTDPVRGYYGIDVLGGGHTIDGNVIDGLGSHGIVLSGSNTTGNVITNNAIGAHMYNLGAGIDIDAGAHDNVIGTAVFGTESSGGNVITSNVGPGVAIEGATSTGNRVDGDNLIYNNAGLSIDLSNDGPTTNDAAGDADAGANKLQNFPVLSEALRLSDGTVRLGGKLQVDHNGVKSGYRIDLFLTDEVFCGARGDMANHLGFFIADTNGSVDATWSDQSIAAGLTPAIVPDLSNEFVVATATDPYGNTSEPTPCFKLNDEHIFSATFEK